jgi:structural maintenance of chromosomes protein 5
VTGLKDRVSEIMKRLEEEKENVLSADRQTQTIKSAADEAKEQLVEMFADEAMKETCTELSEGKSLDEIEHEIQAEEAKLEILHAANPNVIRDFERRAVDIEALRKTIADSSEKLTSIDQNIGSIMEQWEPRLEELVSKINDAFSYNFEQISCAGEIRVHKDDDFEQWALDIMVKFRYLGSFLSFS